MNATNGSKRSNEMILFFSNENININIKKLCLSRNEIKPNKTELKLTFGLNFFKSARMSNIIYSKIPLIFI